MQFRGRRKTGPLSAWCADCGRHRSSHVNGYCYPATKRTMKIGSAKKILTSKSDKAEALSSNRTDSLTKEALTAPPNVGFTLKDKGLQNSKGENNCFLNVCIQALWHLKGFRRRMFERNIHEHRELVNTEGAPGCIFCALQEIFSRYEFSEDGVIPPYPLRNALAAAWSNEGRFQLNAMDDATEAFEAILNFFHFDELRLQQKVAQDSDKDARGTGNSADLSRKLYDALDTPCQPECMAHEVFGYERIDQKRCMTCKATNEPVSCRNFVYRVYVSEFLQAYKYHKIYDDGFICPLCKCELPSQRKLRKHLQYCTGVAVSKKDAVSLVEVLKTINNMGKPGKCPSHDYKRKRLFKCKGKQRLESWCTNLPEAFVIAPVWPTNNAPKEDIEQMARVISQDIDLRDIFKFPKAITSCSKYPFVGMVCFYGRHYMCFFYNKAAKMWLLFDDYNVKKVGPWEQVHHRLVNGRLQPVLLFYENLKVSGTSLTQEQVISRREKIHQMIDNIDKKKKIITEKQRREKKENTCKSPEGPINSDEMNESEQDLQQVYSISCKTGPLFIEFEYNKEHMVVTKIEEKASSKFLEELHVGDILVEIDDVETEWHTVKEIDEILSDQRPVKLTLRRGANFCTGKSKDDTNVQDATTVNKSAVSGIDGPILKTNVTLSNVAPRTSSKMDSGFNLKEGMIDLTNFFGGSVFSALTSKEALPLTFYVKSKRLGIWFMVSAPDF